MEELKILYSYFKSMASLCLTICWFIGIKYAELNNIKNILIYVFIASNLVIWSLYFSYSFCKDFKRFNNKGE